MNTILIRVASVLAALLLCVRLHAQVPNLINHQGRVAVNGVNFDGNGEFKFALVDAAGTTTYWSNDGTSAGGSEPSGSVRLAVSKGLYSVLLGDASRSNMTAVPASVFTRPDVRLRVWFSNLSLGFQLLTPDQRLAPNGYLPDGAVTSAKLAPGTAILPVGVNGPSQAAAANTNYVVTSATPVSFTLPASANVGDTIQITGAGAGGWFVPGIHDTWRADESTRGWTAIASSADGLKLAAVVNTGNVYTSTNAGVNWSPRSITGFWRTMASSADGTRLVAGGESGLWLSSDSGATWTQGPSGTWLSVACSADGLKIIAAAGAPTNPPSGAVATSPNGGVNWDIPLNGVGAGKIWYAVASSADGTRLVAAEAGGPLSLSTNSGATWSPVGPIGPWRTLTSSADGTKLAVAGEGTLIYVSTDSGQNWTPRATNLSWKGLASSTDGAKLAAVALNDRAYTSSDAGTTWTARDSTRAWSGIASSADGFRLAATVFGGQIYTSFASVASGTANTEATLVYTGASTGWQQAGAAGPQIQSGQIADGAVALRNLAPDALMWTPLNGNIYRGTGNVGIGTSTPNASLSFGSSIANTKLALWDGGGTAYGLGIQASQFRLHVDQPGSRFSFLNAPAGSELLTIKGTGNVGIGTATPNYPLSMGAGIGDTKLALFDAGPGSAYGMGIQAAQFRFHVDAPSARFSFLDAPAGNELMTILGTGGVGIGRTPATNRLEVEGNASKATAGSWLANSDRRIKTDIQPVTGALATIEKVNPVTFRYTEEYLRAHPDIRNVPYYNVIAQEFRDVYPDAVKSSGEKLPDGSGILQVDTYPATITAIAAIKELKAENDALKQRLAALEETVRRMQPTTANAK